MNENELAWVNEAAAAGSAECAFLLGFLYHNGLCLPQSYEKAVTLYKQAADNGLGAAQYALATLYDAGKGVEKSALLAYRYALLAAKQGIPAAQLLVSFCTMQGVGIDMDIVAGRRWLEEAVKNGSTEAKRMLAIALDAGGPGDKGTAHQYWQDLAKDEDAGALFLLASALLHGDSCNKDEQLGLRLLHKAADLGSTYAAGTLALVYGKGLFGVLPDQQKSDYYFDLGKPH